jgi:hypothetical protein
MVKTIALFFFLFIAAGGSKDIPKVKIIAVMEDTCPISIQYLHHLKALHQKQNALVEVKVLLVPGSKAKKFTRDYDLTFPVETDTKWAFTKKYAVKTVPEFFVFTDSDSLLYRGLWDDGVASLSERERVVSHAYVTEVIEAALSSAPIPYQQTEPIGCRLTY